MSSRMYIINASCWKCDQPMNVAVIDNESNKGNGFRGPDTFSKEEHDIAIKNGVIIKQHKSYTLNETYNANTCPHCSVFIGQHYLFTDYFVEAMNGYYQYLIIDV